MYHELNAKLDNSINIKRYRAFHTALSDYGNAIFGLATSLGDLEDLLRPILQEQDDQITTEQIARKKFELVINYIAGTKADRKKLLEKTLVFIFCQQK